MADRSLLSARLRKRRRSLGLKTPEAAAICGVSQPTYSRWENEGGVDEDSLDGIARFLGVTRAEVVLLRSGEDAAPVVTQVEELAAKVDRLTELVRKILPPDEFPDTL